MKKLYGIPLIGAVLLFSTLPAMAQVNCKAAATRAGYIRCLRQQTQIYRDSARSYNEIARDLYRTHRRTGRILRRFPILGRYATPAWNVPRYYYRFRYGRP